MVRNLFSLSKILYSNLVNEKIIGIENPTQLDTIRVLMNNLDLDKFI